MVVMKISHVFEKNLPHFLRNLPRFFEKLRRFSENLPRFEECALRKYLCLAQGIETMLFVRSDFQGKTFESLPQLSLFVQTTLASLQSVLQRTFPE